MAFIKTTPLIINYLIASSKKPFFDDTSCDARSSVSRHTLKIRGTRGLSKACRLASDTHAHVSDGAPQFYQWRRSREGGSFGASARDGQGSAKGQHTRDKSLRRVASATERSTASYRPPDQGSPVLRPFLVDSLTALIGGSQHKSFALLTPFVLTFV